MWKQIARRLLPSPIYGLGRRWLRRCRRRQRERLPYLSEAEFRRILVEELGLGSDQVVFVHSSLAWLRLGFPFYQVLSLLREVVGPRGTLLFPCTQLAERPETWLARGEVFDVRHSPTTMGLIPEFARRQREAVRSLHPTHSVVALGYLARELTQRHPHSLYPCGSESPFYQTAECGGRIIGLGVDVRVMTFVHCLEDIWQERFPVETRSSQVYAGRVRDEQGREQVIYTLVAHPRIYWRNIPRYMRRYVPAPICRSFRLHGADFYRADAAALYRKMEELAGRGITIYPRLVYRDNPLERPLTWLARWAG